MAGMGSGILVDTNILIEHLREGKKKEETAHQIVARQFEKILISSISVYEIEYGALRAGRTSDILSLLGIVEIIPFGKQEAEEAANIWCRLFQQGIRIGIRDIFIAGIAIKHRLPVFTRNTEHFEKIPGIRLFKL